MRIVICYKSVPNDQEIKVKDNGELDTSHAELTISRYDLDATEAAMQLSEEGDRVVALSFAGEAVNNSKLRKAILSRGPQELFLVHSDDAEQADSLYSAQVLKAAIEKIGDVDVVFCGEGSEDMYCQQVGPLLGSLLGWNTVNAVSSVKKSGDFLKLVRNLESCAEELEVKLPAVICGTGGMSTPRIPKMKDILSAGKKPFIIWELQELGTFDGNRSETCSILALQMKARKCDVFREANDETIEAFYQKLRRSM